MVFGKNLKKAGAVAAALILGASYMPQRVLAAEGPSLSGFIDFGYNYNFNGLDTNVLRSFDSNANTFTLNNAEIVLQGKMDNDIGYRTDIDFGNDAKLQNLSDGTSAATTGVNLQQAFITIPCPLTKGVFTVGKFVTMHGAEVIEAKDNFNQSRGNLFNFAIPLTHTGVKYDKGFMEGKLALSGAIVNGWDSSKDTNKGKSFMAQVGFSGIPKTAITLGGMYGPEQASPEFSKTAPGAAASTEKNTRSLVDFILKVTPTDKLTLVANADYGTEKGLDNGTGFVSPDADNVTADWEGIALYGNYAWTDMWSTALRWENFADDGTRTAIGSPVVLDSLTLTLQCKCPVSGLISRLEYRQDTSNKDVYLKDDGTPDDTQSTIGVSWSLPFGG